MFAGPHHLSSRNGFKSQDHPEQLQSLDKEVPQRTGNIVHEVIHQMCLNQPHATAIAAWDGNFTYRELDKLSSRLALYLASLGAGRDMIIPLYFELGAHKSRWISIAILGVLKCGGGFLLLDPQHSRSRLKEVCRIVDAKLILSSSFNATFAAALAPMLVVVQERQEYLQRSDNDWTIVSSVKVSDTVYVFFTSETTGVQTPAVIDHAAIFSSCVEVVIDGLYRGSKELPYATDAANVSIDHHLRVLIAGGRVDLTPLQQEKSLPATASEIILQALCSRLLSLPQESIGTHDNLFRLGADSIIAMKLVTAARREGFDLTVSDILAHPRISDLSTILRPIPESGRTEYQIVPFSLLPRNHNQESLIRSTMEQCQIGRDEIEDLYPATPLQTGLISLTENNPSMYTEDFIFELRNGISVSRFKAAWQAALAANVTLRTRIVQLGSAGFFQVVLRASPIDWITWKSLDAYLSYNATKSMGTGKPLARFGIIVQSNRPVKFVLTLHHSIYDAYFSLIFDQVEEAFKGASLPTRRFSSFVDYIMHMNGHEDFWRAQFDGCKAAVFPSLPSTSYTAVANSSISHKMRDISLKKLDYTPSALIRMAWAILMSHYTDSDDIVYGITLSGRSAPVANIDQMTGPTITTIPLRITFEQGQTVHEALIAHQYQMTAMIPFEQTGIQNIKQISNEAAAACEFQSHIGIQPPRKPLCESLMTYNHSYDYGRFSSYALVIVCHLSDIDDTIMVSANFDSNVMEEFELQRILYQFQNILKQISEDPHQQIKSVLMCSPQDMVNLLEDWNSLLPPANDVCLHEYVVEHSISRPDDIAVRAWDGEFTFLELEQQSASIAKYLRDLGVTFEAFVPLCFDKSKWAIVAMTSVLRAGGACVCIDPDLPPQRVRHMIEQTSAKLILSSPSNVQAVSHHGASILSITGDTFDSLPSIIETQLPKVPVHNPAFLIFTSGSTGVPKAIILEHVNLSTSIQHHSEIMHVTRDSRVLHFASYAFDISIYEVWTTLVMGGTVCVPSKLERLNDLAGFITRNDVNLAISTPSAMRLLEPDEVACLKTVMVGGEAIPQDTVETWGAKVNLLNGYGPAESTICAAGKITQGWRTGTIGRVVGGRGWITTVNDASKLAAIGAVGELVMEGPVLAREYLNQPDKTAASFIPSPPWLKKFSPSTKRVYRTGDLMKYDSDGSIRYVGRKDTQVKLRGMRIELGEVEFQVLQCFHSVREAVAEVILPKDKRQAPFLTAFVVLERDDYNNTAGDSGVSLLAASDEFHSERCAGEGKLYDVLPRYMVPTVFIPISRIPIGNTSKCDRKYLRELAGSLSRTDLEAYTESSQNHQHDSCMPSTDAEKAFQRIWGEVLNIDPSQIGVNESFLRLGGDSILAVRISARARSIGLSITVSDILRFRSITEIMRNVTQSPLVPDPVQRECKLIEQHAGPQLGPVGSESFMQTFIKPQLLMNQSSKDEIEDVLPTTEFQREDLKCHYFLVNIPGRIDSARLKQAINSTIQNHSILRTLFVPSKPHGILQVVLRKLQIPLPRRETDQNLELFSELLCRKDHIREVPWGTSTFQAELVLRNEASHMLILRLSHAQFDGCCISNLFTSLAAAYENPTTAEFGSNYSLYMQHRLAQKSTKAFQFWEEYLSGASMTEFAVPPLTPHTDWRRTQATKDIPLPSPPQNITSATLFKAAWSLVFSRLTKQRDIVFGQIANGRSLPMPNVDCVLGPCVNVSPVRTIIDPAWTALDLLSHVGEQHLRTLPFETLDACEIIANSTSWEPDTRFSCILAYQNFPPVQDTLVLDGIQCSFRKLELPILLHEVEISAYPGPSGWVLDLAGPGWILGSGQAERILEELAEKLVMLSERPTERLYCASCGV